MPIDREKHVLRLLIRTLSRNCLRCSAFISLTFFGLASAQAGFGTLEKTYPDWGVSKFVLHPNLPYIFASINTHDSVAMINTNTLNVEQLIPVGSRPHGLAIAPDGSELYVANSNSKSISVINTSSRSVVRDLMFTSFVSDVEVGADGRLYVQGQDELMQIHPSTGASVGPSFGSFVYSGELEISPGKDRLYYADYGLSPSSIYQYDITQNTPSLLWESGHGDSGSNGQDLQISHDGSFISYPCGAGQGGYKIAKYRTSDMAIVGSFDTSAYPREIAFSPDDAVAYTVNESYSIKTWSTSTFSSLGTIPVAGTNVGEVSELFVDRTGQHLFAAYSDTYYNNFELRVYGTGRFVVPEPSSAVLFAAIAVAFFATTRRSFRYSG
jgi:YVTN family beta-propeller protein